MIPTAATTSAHGWLHLSSQTDFLIGAGIVLLLILAWIPVTREILKGIFGKLLIPAFSASLQIFLRWIVKQGKWILQAHGVILRNLVSSHRAIHPTLRKPKT